MLITGPVNTSKGRIQGFEAQVSTFFDFDCMPDWARGFGAQANVTYIDAKADFPIVRRADLPNPAMPITRLRIPDVSKWTYNLVGMYERGRRSRPPRLQPPHRLPRGRRSAERDDFFTLQGRGQAVSRLDWSSSYAFNDNLTVFFDWTNILGNRSGRTSCGSITASGDAERRGDFPDGRPLRGIGHDGRHPLPLRRALRPAAPRFRRRWQRRCRGAVEHPPTAPFARCRSPEEAEGGLIGPLLARLAQAHADLRLAVLPEQGRDVEVALVVGLAAAPGRRPGVEGDEVAAARLEDAGVAGAAEAAGLPCR